MISPHTPPGTQVCCIDATPGRFGFTGLTRGAYYTVQSIEIGAEGGFLAILEGIEPPWGYLPPRGLVRVGYDLRRFRPLELPKIMYELGCELEDA